MMQTHEHRPTLLADPSFNGIACLVRVCVDCGVLMERATR